MTNTMSKTMLMPKLTTGKYKSQRMEFFKKKEKKQIRMMTARYLQLLELIQRVF